MAGEKKCKKKLAGGKSRHLPGVLAQTAECCAWITPGCLTSKGAFAKHDIP